jgi:phage tail-like protein
MSADERHDPYLTYQFVVEIEGLRVGGFSGASGLSVEMQPEEVQEGGVNHYTHKLPTRYGHGNLVLKRGLTDYAGLWEWVESASEGVVTRRNVDVYLLDGTRDLVWGWTFLSTYPVKWTGPEFQADQSAVAVETLELVHAGVRAVEGLPSA